jgi:hypothetical protein
VDFDSDSVGSIPTTPSRLFWTKKQKGDHSLMVKSLIVIQNIEVRFLLATKKWANTAHKDKHLRQWPKKIKAAITLN